MTKFILFLSLTLTACSSTPTVTDVPPETPKTIRDEKCLDSSKMVILQVLDTGVLAWLCPTEYSRIYANAFEACSTEGDTVYMQVSPENNDYVDDQKISLADDRCFVADGTYRYLNKDRFRKTVRKIKIEKSQVTNPQSRPEG